MKISRLFILVFLVMALLPGYMQPVQGDDFFMVGGGRPGLLKNSGQLTNLYLDAATGNWIQILPNGTTQTFVWGNGKSFVMTIVSVRFYANTTNTNPYRLFFRAPNGNIIWMVNLPNLTYPSTGSNVLGGALLESITPGIVMTVKPSAEVRQMPVPPNDPNSGPVIPGAMHLGVVGYVVP
jgi:hypothetical protein